ncbi:hypothetical protein [Bacillus proteolyticus]|uniref:hypothetical protein n=1 Tax=Bacillus proteolyticus TaxID=2026192 RepID=UPI0030F49758
MNKVSEFTKSECWLEDGKRKIINLYYDFIPSEKFIYAKIETVSEHNVLQVKFWIEQNSLDDEAFRRINTHFQRLRLLGRYQEKAISEMVGLIKTISQYKYLSRDSISQILEFSRNKEFNKFGINYWMTALYDAVLHDEEFIFKIIKGEYNNLLMNVSL